MTKAEAALAVATGGGQEEDGIAVHLAYWPEFPDEPFAAWIAGIDSAGNEYEAETASSLTRAIAEALKAKR